MKFNVKSGSPEKHQSSCVIVGVFEPSRLSPVAEELDTMSNNYITKLLQKGELKGKIGQSLLLHNVPNISSERILLIGCGKEDDLYEDQYKEIIKETISILNNTGATEAIYFLASLHVKNRNSYWKIRQAIETIKKKVYTFNHLKSDQSKKQQPLSEITFNVSNKNDLSTAKLAISHGIAVSLGIESAKDLANMPPNICNTSYLSSKASQLSKNYQNLNTTIIDEKQMKELMMNAYLAVGKGSKNKSLMSVMEYKGNDNPKQKAIVLIGKGLTFDSGGISIKPSDGMEEMKYDMCGAATVYGVMHFVAELNLPINIIGVLAGCENMPSSKSYRPGDILTTMSGKTVEVLNTDAEGRLVLCDALTYVERFNPDVVIDVATLTGACVIALGNHYTGLMSNHNPLAHELLHASKQAGDKAWRLPLDKKFYEQLESRFADLSNVGGRMGGAITAGCFLESFATKYRWAHLDIAGTSWKSGKKGGATGRPVALLAQFLLNRVYSNFDDLISN